VKVTGGKFHKIRVEGGSPTCSAVTVCNNPPSLGRKHQRGHTRSNEGDEVTIMKVTESHRGKLNGGEGDMR
jgi:hypothetical protein